MDSEAPAGPLLDIERYFLRMVHRVGEEPELQGLEGLRPADLATLRLVFMLGASAAFHMLASARKNRPEYSLSAIVQHLDDEVEMAVERATK